jgi:Ulp1 family protease
VDIFERDYLLFPHHDAEQNHWSLYIVCYPSYFLLKESITSQDNFKLLAFAETKPYIVYFDSFGFIDKDTSRLISQYPENYNVNELDTLNMN